jgi:hypothetical protein
MFHVNLEDLMNHKEATKSRQKLDSKSEDSLFRVLTNFGMFNFTNESENLLSIGDLRLCERDHLLSAIGVLVIPTIPYPFFPVALSHS